MYFELFLCLSKPVDGFALKFADTIGLHIRSCGTWTNRLYQFFEEKQKMGQLDIIFDKKDSSMADETKPPTPIPTRSGYVNIAIDEDDCSTSTVTTTGCMATPSHEPNCCSNNTNKLTPGRRRVYANRRSSSVVKCFTMISILCCLHDILMRYAAALFSLRCNKVSSYCVTLEMG